jgi:hypothetical protein
MEQNDHEELRSLLREWQAPLIPSSLERRVLTARKSGWRFFLHGFIRVPVPVACCIVTLLAVAEVWRWTRPAVMPTVLVKTERVEVPVLRERVVTKVIYKNRTATANAPNHALTFHQLRPVAVLQPRIIRGRHDQN